MIIAFNQKTALILLIDFNIILVRQSTWSVLWPHIVTLKQGHHSENQFINDPQGPMKLLEIN